MYFTNITVLHFWGWCRSLLVYGSCLIVDVTQHKMRLYVNFCKTWPTGLPDAPVGFTSMRVHASDKVPMFKSNNENVASVTKCPTCCKNIRFPVHVPNYTCKKCKATHGFSTIRESDKIIESSDASKQCFEITINGVVVRHTFLVNSKYIPNAPTHFIWALSASPFGELKLLQCPPKFMQDCEHCKDKPSYIPPTIPEFNPNTFLATQLDQIDSDAQSGTCFVCGVMLPKKDMHWLHTFTAKRYFIQSPENGCYMCYACCAPCSDCGNLTVREIDTLCDDCA